MPESLLILIFKLNFEHIQKSGPARKNLQSTWRSAWCTG